MGETTGRESRGEDRGVEESQRRPALIPAVCSHMRDTKSELPTGPADSQNPERYYHYYR